MTKLLVSVRSAREARAALAGGADVIDVKEPRRGSLGMADAGTIAEIVHAVAVRSTSVPACDRSPHPSPLPEGEGAASQPVSPPLAVSPSLVEAEGAAFQPGSTSPPLPLSPSSLPATERAVSPPVSAALGEARDWLACNQPARIPGGLTYTKLGLAGLVACGDWTSAWMQARGRVERCSQGVPRWIAVAYVDWQSAEAPAPWEVVDAAGNSDCAGVLFDTCRKGPRGLLDWLDLPELKRLIETIQTAGMLAAVAGGLRLHDAGPLVDAGADILAIRTAACDDGRNGTVSESAVRRFRAAIDAARTSAAAGRDRRPAG